MPELTSGFGAFALWGLLGYLLGSVPFGMISARLFGLGNLRDIGSGNIGATNVLRTGNKAAAATTLLFDAGKGALAVLLAGSFAGDDAQQIAGVMALVGHCFPIWLSFKGGKGVATFFGVLLGLAWPVFLVCGAAWLITAAIGRMSSLAALITTAFSPLAFLSLGYPSMVLASVILAILIFWRHSENIQRLRNGTESKIGQKS
ncbi:MAG: glycerol-3-phosphate 1-O-acyltransferase PlsY [Pseudomonadota bacterium]